MTRQAGAIDTGNGFKPPYPAETLAWCRRRTAENMVYMYQEELKQIAEGGGSPFKDSESRRFKELNLLELKPSRNGVGSGLVLCLTDECRELLANVQEAEA